MCDYVTVNEAAHFWDKKYQNSPFGEFMRMINVEPALCRIISGFYPNVYLDEYVLLEKSYKAFRRKIVPRKGKVMLYNRAEKDYYVVIDDILHLCSCQSNGRSAKGFAPLLLLSGSLRKQDVECYNSINFSGYSDYCWKFS